MDLSNRHSASPEDQSEGNDTLSAPSEFLAEFLSAIMRRQYAEALKYCRLILQYEPHNATARGFYPLLRHKLDQPERGEWLRGSSSEEASAAAGPPSPAPPAAPAAQELMQCGGDSEPRSLGASSGSQSSLELDSEPGLSLVDSDGPASASVSASASASASGSSSGPASGSGAGRRRGSWPAPEALDDNGNASLVPTPRAGDVENDNASEAGDAPLTARLQGEAASLRRLRAQFACSIK